MKYLFSITT